MAIEHQGGQRILAGTVARLRVRFYRDGVAADPGTVTVRITRLDGSTVTPEPASADVDGETYEATYALAAEHTAELDVLTVTWASEQLGTVTTTAEIVGAHLFTLNEARAHDGADMADPTAYPNHVIEEARDRITDAFEEVCGVSFIPRVRQAVLNGNGTVLLMLPPRVDYLSIRSVETRSGSIWTAFAQDELDDVILEPWGGLTRESRGVWPRGPRNIRVTYEHGYDQPPLQIKRAGLLLLRDSIVASNIDQRAMSYTDSAGTYRFITPGLSKNAWFALPEVNAILKEYVDKVPVIG